MLSHLAKQWHVLFEDVVGPKVCFSHVDIYACVYESVKGELVQ